MDDGPELRTGRLLLRRWREPDRDAFAALNADPAVMEHFPRTLTREESDDFVDRVESHFDAAGWGLWAVEVPGVDPFIGFVGLWSPSYVVPGRIDEGTVEVGWRLAREAWGHGYAPEAAVAALGFAFGELGLGEVVSFTSLGNVRSQRVMRKAGMRRAPERDFDHPRIDPLEHPHLVRHVVYLATASSWSAGSTAAGGAEPAGARPA